MENFDFNAREKLRFLFFLKINSKRFAYTNIFLNLGISFFIIYYTQSFYVFQKDIAKYHLILIEMFNIFLSVFLVILYLGIRNRNYLESKKLLFFYFYWKIFHASKPDQSCSCSR